MPPLFQVTVLLPHPFSTPKRWTLEVPARDAADAADRVFHLSNCPEAAMSGEDRDIVERFPRTGLRSVSVGDILVIRQAGVPGETHILTVDPVGFSAV